MYNKSKIYVRKAEPEPLMALHSKDGLLDRPGIEE
jgi:hypothetical protein